MTVQAVPSSVDIQEMVGNSCSVQQRSAVQRCSSSKTSVSESKSEGATQNGSCRVEDSASRKSSSEGSKEALPTVCGLPIKWLSLVLLTFVTSWTIFSMKLARSSSQAYLNSSVILVTEVLKFSLSSALLAFEIGSFRLAMQAFWIESRSNFSEMLKLAVPGLAYTIQNNLILISVDSLSAAVQQVTYQLKILAAALLSVVLLGRTIGKKRWVSLIILIAGVVLVQLPRDVQLKKDLSVGNAVAGFGAALGACFASGFGGVYMEMVLKRSPKSIWLRNVQLSIFGATSAVLGIMTKDSQAVLSGGLTQGYTAYVWLMAFTVASGGLLVAAVLKYADNILRQFSTAISVILTACLSSFVLQEITLDAKFGVGTCLTICATFLYSGSLDTFLPPFLLR